MRRFNKGNLVYVINRGIGLVSESTTGVTVRVRFQGDILVAPACDCIVIPGAVIRGGAIEQWLLKEHGVANPRPLTEDP
jgi:hypothetical protein